MQWDIVLRLGLAVICGSIIGLNRYLYRKDAGMRTNALVALGAAMATMVVMDAHDSDSQALSRVLQGLVTGVGFIGAGVIMREASGKHVRGLTTAASIWISAILGIAMGAGDYPVGAVGLTFALLALVVGKPIEKALASWLTGDDDDNGHETNRGD
ncbi:MAG: MgtC/SapB family protein [Spongiibacteraceae bacterium]